MSILYSKDLTDEQSEALERAAFLIIQARKEATALLERSGLDRALAQHWFGNPCHALEGLHRCGCSDYTGDGGPCLTPTTTDPGFPPTRSCGHQASQHIET